MSVRETLELDISDALASIEQVGDRLANVAQAFGEVLSESLEAALNGLPIITPEVDATPVSDEVEQALTEAAATPVDVTADVTADAEAVTDETQAAVDAVDATIEVTADVGPAEDALSGLTEGLTDVGGASEEASGGLGATAAAAGLAGRAAGSASGIIGKASGALAGLGPVGLAAGAAIGATATSVGFLYDAAFESVAVTQAWENSLGDLGARIEDLDSGTTGFSVSLRQLAQDTGSSDEAVLIATQRYAEFQRAAGFTNDQIVENSQGIAVLAAQIRANNPNLGTMDQIITALGRSLQRGGPRLQAYGIALNSADIEARALADTGKTVASELTNAEKSAAGLAIATEQLQPSAANLAGGLDNVAIKADRARQKFGDALEAIGAPLVEPITQAMLDLATAFEDLAIEIAPAVEIIGEDLGNALKGVIASMQFTIRILDASTAPIRKLTGVLDDTTAGLQSLEGATTLVENAWMGLFGIIGPAIGLFGFLADRLGLTEEVSEDAAGAIRNTGVAEAEATRITNEFWLSVERTSNELANATAANSLFYASITTLAETAMSNIPQVTDAFRNLGTETNADILTGNLQAQIAATNRWAADMEMAYALGFENIGMLLAEIGPTQSAILLAQYAGREKELEDHLALMAIAQQNAFAKSNEIALRGYLKLNDITGAQANAIVATFGARLQLGTPTQAEIDAVIASPKRKELEAMAAFGDFAGATSKSVTDIVNEETGKAIAKNLDAGLGAGLSVEQAQAVWRAAIYAQKVKDKINEIFGVKSPSTEMMDTGRNLVLGLAMGIGQNTGLMDGAMNALGQSVLGVNLSAGAPTIRDVTVQVPVTVSAGMTADDGRAIGQAAGQAAAAEVARMMRLEARVA